MARTLTPRDISAVMNSVYSETTGQTGTLTQENLSDFVSVGEKSLATGYENTINALSLVFGRTIVAVRPYDAKFRLIDSIEEGAFANRLRKISFYEDDYLAAGDWNTQLYTNLADGFTNGQNLDAGGTPQSVKSMWEQRVWLPVEMIFGGSSVWDLGIVYYKDQLKVAFRGPEEFGNFWAGINTKYANKVVHARETHSRIALLNYLGALINKGMVMNLTPKVNQLYGQTWTSAQIMTEHRKELMTTIATQIKILSNLFTDDTSIYHWNPTRADGKVILRHTPKNLQKLFLSNYFLTETEAIVMPTLFNEDWLSIDNYEGVNYWQNINDPLKINVVPSIPNADGTQQITGNAVEETVVGVLFDNDALMTQLMMEDVLTSPVEARKRYWTSWAHFNKGAINDLSENGIVFILKDETQ